MSHADKEQTTMPAPKKAKPKRISPKREAKPKARKQRGYSWIDNVSANNIKLD